MIVGGVHPVASITSDAARACFEDFSRCVAAWIALQRGCDLASLIEELTPPGEPAAALGTNGVFAPLLLSDRAEELPRPLERYFLSVQPGYEDDPGDAVYNRVWILGDDEAISVAQQAAIDRITELVPVQPDEG